ncbi:uncharacterized protein LOC113499591 [Trichoplusia ni]|uniref:Uncharacterized protein LOC113499591 n=1 Tax=Trichoplusia ni TaxID=7111 RepID=A0A7E5W5Z0_TRINI|nr:uncharacterized protein LOC113499591 [Trichoplusia ni]
MDTKRDTKTTKARPAATHAPVRDVTPTSEHPSNNHNRQPAALPCAQVNNNDPLDLSNLKATMPPCTRPAEALWQVVERKGKPKKDTLARQTTQAPSTPGREGLEKLSRGQRRRRARAERLRRLEEAVARRAQPEVPRPTAPARSAMAKAAPTSEPNQGAGPSSAASAGINSAAGDAEGGGASRGRPGESGGAASNEAAAMRAVPRGKRGGRPRWVRREEAALESRPAKGGKRARPDDSLTPREKDKRAKLSRSSLGPGAVNYADALRSNDLCVAVRYDPHRAITEEQYQLIQERIMEEYDTTIFSTDPTVRTPAFRGRTFLSEGVIKMWCEDEFALNWLRRTTNKIPSPIPGTKLVVCRQRDIPQRVKGAVYVPDFTDGDVDRLRIRLHKANADTYDINSWCLYNAQRTPECDGIRLLLGIPMQEAEVLKQKERRLRYKLGSVYVKFVDEKEEDDNKGEKAPITNAPNDEPLNLAPGEATEAPVEAVTSVLRHPGPSMDQEMSADTPARPRESTPEAVDWWRRVENEAREEMLLGSDGPDSSPTKPH